MGKWYKQPRPPVDTHTHEQPYFVTNDTDVIKGDRFQCACGDVFEVREVYECEAYGSPNGMTGLLWRRVHAPGVMRDTRLDN